MTTQQAHCFSGLTVTRGESMKAHSSIKPPTPVNRIFVCCRQNCAAKSDKSVSHFPYWTCACALRPIACVYCFGNGTDLSLRLQAAASIAALLSSCWNRRRRWCAVVLIGVWKCHQQKPPEEAGSVTTTRHTACWHFLCRSSLRWRSPKELIKRDSRRWCLHTTKVLRSSRQLAALETELWQCKPRSLMQRAKVPKGATFHTFNFVFDRWT